ncbi:STAS domain-containing protein [Streptomyces jeddahensis]|uniref:STAS domain protein n=1 Tax=Streptomyces jeddahensis TaxID=1716141 RepID=A0A177HIB7_9ACTN|nr:STAS domain-containing protein [Streptomyces jeddahensis]OAH10349.1 STAS domain protein [Streptomyces jeddahensis]
MHSFRLRRRFRPKRHRAHQVVRLRGEIDARNANAIGQRLLKAVRVGPDVLEVDLARVTYLSPDGCASFFAALAAARAQGSHLRITHANDRALSTLREIGLCRVLHDTDGGDR